MTIRRHAFSGIPVLHSPPSSSSPRAAGGAPGAPSALSHSATTPPSASPSTDPTAIDRHRRGRSTDPARRRPGRAGRLVIPKPGQLDVRPILAEKLAAVIDGRRVVVTVRFTSGVEPCYVLDSIVVARGDKSFAITLREGHGPGDVMCIEMAETKAGPGRSGRTGPGTYTITDATGGAPAIGVVVS